MVIAISKNERSQLVYRRPPFEPEIVIVFEGEIEILDAPLEVEILCGED